MKHLIISGILAFSSMVAFAGNGEKEIVQSELKKIENSTIHDIQSLDNDEPTYKYEYWIWISMYENGIGDYYGVYLMEPPVCQTEAQMEQMKAQLQDQWQPYYSYPIQIKAEVLYECN